LLAILALTPLENALGVDLSLLAKLSVLRIHIDSFAMAYDTLSTITPSSSIRRLTLYFSYSTSNTWARLDAMLASLSFDSPLNVELKIGHGNYASYAPFLPLLSSNNMVRRCLSPHTHP
jgi:hypothetical protein